MGLFGFGKKKKEEQQTPTCCCGSVPQAAEKSTGTCCGEEVDGICCVKVLGAGCASCHEQLENAQKAVKNLGLPVEVEYVTDLQKVMEYGVMSLPAIVVNDKVAAMGKVLKAADVEKLLRKQ
ncbi:MAG: thioredoxin family protein [Bacillota bacterium]|nr:thioredoxin family protein [Bacillota bacterium]